jgi:hypothetical protein
LFYLVENTNLTRDNDRRVKVVEFDKDYCHIEVIIPRKEEKMADIAGTNTCRLAVQWMKERGYSFNDYTVKGRTSVICYVYSLAFESYERLGKTRWGYARYDIRTDEVEWRWKELYNERLK